MVAVPVTVYDPPGPLSVRVKLRFCPETVPLMVACGNPPQGFKGPSAPSPWAPKEITPVAWSPANTLVPVCVRFVSIAAYGLLAPGFCVEEEMISHLPAIAAGVGLPPPLPPSFEPPPQPQPKHTSATRVR